MDQEARRNYYKLVCAQKSKSGGPVGRLRSFIAQHVVGDDKVKSIGGNARKQSFRYTKWSDLLATCSSFTVLKAFRKHLSAITTIERSSFIKKHKPQNVG